MKYFNLILLTALFFSACKKQERIPNFKEEIVRQNSGTITADMNGIFWNYPKAVVASYSRVANNRFTINVYLFKGEAWDASLDINDIRLNERQSVINPLFYYEPVDSLRKCFSHFANIAGGDAPENTYQVLQDSLVKTLST
ncbi:MAG: hypothetical protein EOO06_00570 [Chitinophagaceae bacterium]|nr:MAG: hypothetical protein EOO06_00570 [Chitinophagaceae bacterium]